MEGIVRQWWVTVAHWLLTAAAVVLLCILTVEYANSIGAPGCNDNNPCTADIKTGAAPGWCHNPALPNGTACTSQCFVAGAKGKCQSNLGSTTHGPECRPTDLTKCKGYCAQDPDEVVHFSDMEAECDTLMLPLLLPGFYQDAEYDCNLLPNAISSNLTACVANICTLSTLMATGYEEDGDGVQLPTSFAFTSCDDMLRDGPHRHCVRSIEVPLDSVWVTGMLQDAGYDSFEYVGKMCTFIYDCGGLNMTAFSDPNYFESVDCGKKRFIPKQEAVAPGEVLGSKALFGRHAATHGRRVFDKLAHGAVAAAAAKRRAAKGSV